MLANRASTTSSINEVAYAPKCILENAEDIAVFITPWIDTFVPGCEVAGACVEVSREKLPLLMLWNIKYAW